MLVSAISFRPAAQVQVAPGTLTELQPVSSLLSQLRPQPQQQQSANYSVPATGIITVSYH